MKNLIKFLLLSAIIFSVNNNNCKSMEYNKHSYTSNYNINNSELFNEESKIFESDSEDKKSENNNNIIINKINTNSINNKQEKSKKILEDIINQYNSADQYKYLFDKKYHEKYHKKVKEQYNILTNKNRTIHTKNIDNLFSICSGIYRQFYQEQEYDYCYGWDNTTFYERMLSETSCNGIRDTFGDIEIMNHTELMKYAKLFDSIKWNKNDGLLSNNVENLNKYIITQKEWKNNKSDDVSYLQFIQYVVNNIIRLEPQLLKMKLRSTIELKEDSITIKKIVNVLKHVIRDINNIAGVAEQKWKIKYNKTSIENSFTENIKGGEIFGYIIQTKSDILNKIQNIKNEFDVLHNEIVDNLVNIVQDINNYKIPNTYVVLCKSQDNIKNKDYYKQYIYINRNNKLAKNILLKCENIDVTTSLSLDIHRRNINNFLRSKEVNYVFFRSIFATIDSIL